MTWGRGSGTAAVLALALLAAGCSSGDGTGKAAESPSSSPAASGTVTTTPSTTPSATPSSTPSETPSGTPSATPTTTSSACGGARNTIPDGTWKGPIAMTVRVADGRGGFADARGTGTLTTVVDNGAVTGGSWRLTWTSRGHAESGQATAEVTVDGKVRGVIKGPAARPFLSGSWTITGEAVVTANGQTFTQPIEETGVDTSRMTSTSPGCDRVTGTFVPEFRSKETLATFTGTARWTGSRVG